MNKEKRRVPKLRFPGFTEDWEQRKLGECVDISTGYPFDSQDFNENGEYLVITNGNIQDNTPFVLNNVGNRIDLDDSLKKYILDIDDLLITMDGTVGRVAIVVDNKLVLAQRVCRIKSNEPYYIYQLLSKNDFIQSMNKIGHGGTIKHISLSEISEYQAFYPKSQKERIKISSVLTNHDKLITLHQRKLEYLKLEKKALLQKLFPKNGERYPELRFPGFTDAWEQRKLSDISTKVTTKNVDVHYTETLTNSAEQGIISQADFFDKEISNKDNINGYYIVDNNDFIYNPRISTLAPVGPINRNKLNRTGIMSPLYTVFRASKVDLGFLEWYFQSNHWHRYMKLNGDSGARADRIAIKDSTFFEMPIKIPVNIKEQVLIGETLEKFNQYITLHQRKLRHLQLQKKALLQQMFV